MGFFCRLLMYDFFCGWKNIFDLLIFKVPLYLEIQIKIYTMDHVVNIQQENFENMHKKFYKVVLLQLVMVLLLLAFIWILLLLALYR